MAKKHTGQPEQSEPPELPERLSYSIAGFARAAEMSLPKVYSEIRAGTLRSFTVGRRRYISIEAAKDYIARREAAGTVTADTSKALRARWSDTRTAA